MSILDSFDLNQHVVGATHRDGHTLDLIITRVSDDGLVSNCRVGDRISDHFAVHCDLQFKKPPLERKEITCRKTRSIDFTDFRYNLRNSCLVLDPGSPLKRGRGGHLSGAGGQLACLVIIVALFFSVML